MRLRDKVALITGGSHGIGLAVAIRFAQEGAKVALCGRGKAALDEAIRQIGDAGGTAISFETDVSDKAQVDAMVDGIVNKWGRLDIAVNNAGICEVSSFLDITEDQWDRHMNINLKGAFLVSQRAAREMVRQGEGGSIIQMSSVNGIQAEADQVHYNTTKGGMINLSMSMALELAPHGIRVNALCPGFIETRLTKPLIENGAAIADYLRTVPMKRVGQPEEIAAAALFLASDEASYVTGTSMVVDGGQLIKLS
ncbi:SDR family NAD(P)-dependent oxidoreductase [Paenibacillus ginsengarvi]|uniref:SDR family oxidoreductase n=1 Tax=Paenibacillus ginsengarvi TaxID=400777 RepID=A0A3B0CG55_9BACL|nr:SDR family NAD(P)-dependent oxidoreductase [Paenibacillus ginsengarvi]RKN84190.1 SDR family oxidoreductase [Paenibacillus ginsengarvi]